MLSNTHITSTKNNVIYLVIFSESVKMNDHIFIFTVSIV